MKISPIITAMTISILGLIHSQAEQRYVDTDYNGNTSNAETGSTTDWAIDPAVNANGAPGGDNLWGHRITGPAAPAFGTNVWQISSAENSPTIVTVITGLLPNTTYGGLRLYFTGKESTSAANQWFIDASVDGVTFTTYGDDSTNSTAVDASNEGVGVPVTAGATTDNRYYASLPNGTTDAGGNLRIWVRKGAGADNRSVYDGIGYDDTPLATVGPLQITAFSYNQDAGTGTITWDSIDSAKYLLEVSTDLLFWLESKDEVTGTGTSTTLPIVIADLDLPEDPGSGRVFFRIRPIITN